MATRMVMLRTVEMEEVKTLRKRRCPKMISSKQPMIALKEKEDEMLS